MLSRVPCWEIIRQKTGLGANLPEDTDPSWWDDVFSPSKAGSFSRMDDDTFEDNDISKEELAAHARTLWELECLVSAMDCLETTAAIVEGYRQ